MKQRQVQLLKIVVASPSDVEKERNVVEKVAEELNRGVAADRGLRIEVVRWEKVAFPGFHAEGPQGLIDPLLGIQDSDLVIGIFWKRFGTPTERAQSGTEHEFRKAYQAWKQKGRPQIMVYFNQESYTPQTPEEAEQWRQVLHFRAEFPKEGLWWPYNGEREFEDLLRNHLTQFIRRTAFRRKIWKQVGVSAVILFAVVLMIWKGISSGVLTGMVTPFSNDTLTTEHVTDQPQNTLATSIPDTFSQQTQNPPTIEPPTLVESQSGRGLLHDELTAKGLLAKLEAAKRYSRLGSSDGDEDALELFREVVGRLSLEAKSELDPVLLNEADSIQSAPEAVQKYLALFDAYLPK